MVGQPLPSGPVRPADRESAESTEPAADERPPKELRAVIFDFFGTIACHPDGTGSVYRAVFEHHGYRLDAEVERQYVERYDGVEHVEHSSDQAIYEAWVRLRHSDLARACNVAPGDVEPITDALRALDTSQVVAYPDAEPTLAELHRRGLLVAVCSNWGWELDRSLAEAGLNDLVDVAITSARAGARKPHPRIFTAVTDALGVRPDEALFVGDSFEPDVIGPLGAGMAAVHLCRDGEFVDVDPPELPPAASRIASLSDLLVWPGLGASTPGSAPAPR
jgi:putative hydrolase of the HAD superfamily